MRILCIDATTPNGPHSYLREGEVYEAAGEEKNISGDDCYLILSLPDSISFNRRPNNKPLYLKRRFIKCSDREDSIFEKKTHGISARN